MTKHILIGLLVAVVGIALGAVIAWVRFDGPEDAWLCRDGVWVRQGSPREPIPSEPCFGTAAPTVSQAPVSTPDGIACTEDAKQCPDGTTYVGRTSPRCQWAPCPGERQVLLYYYDPNQDKDALGNVLCSDKGLTVVSRNIPVSATPIQDTVRELLKGALSQDERDDGITTEFPLPGLSLTAASLRDGILTLTFADPQSRTGGGSCRVGVLWAQIRKTAEQFDGVREVRFSPDTLFQP